MNTDTLLQRKYHHFHHYVGSCIFHVVFCTKYRRKVLNDTYAEMLKQIVYDKQEQYGYRVLAVEVMPDHVHLLLDVLDLMNGVHRVVSKIKGILGHELRQQFPKLKSKLPTLWTRSKFIASVGTVNLEAVKAYIDNQKSAAGKTVKR